MARSLGCSVTIVTNFRLKDRNSICGGDGARMFHDANSAGPALNSTRLLIQYVPRLFPQGSSERSLKPTTPSDFEFKNSMRPSGVSHE
jgi:hypothetical protein